ncbi:insulin-like growth factor-binding protein-related protein 1 [Dysidea avara]|uniref:insulin-like growth factor-binding protein-related protein 1 n=1 Tax=Dysidea avara TaxID=196820 RepID=UPI003317E572
MKVFVYLLLLAVVVTICRGLDCPRCRHRKCPPKSVVKQSCQGGVVKDHCGCCFECAKQLNETCGGYLGRLGKCDIGLLCHSYFPSDIPLIPGVCAKLAGCLLINDGDNKWIAVGHTISRRRSCKTCVCQSDGTFDCTKQENCDSGTAEEDDDFGDIKRSTELKQLSHH